MNIALVGYTEVEWELMFPSQNSGCVSYVIFHIERTGCRNQEKPLDRAYEIKGKWYVELDDLSELVGIIEQFSEAVIIKQHYLHSNSEGISSILIQDKECDCCS